MPNNQPISTLYATEIRWRPYVLASLAGCALIAAILLAAARTSLDMVVWLPCAALSGTLILSNVHYLRTHNSTTVGMAPISLMALAPAALATICAETLPLALRMVCGLVLAVCLATCALFGFWFVRLRRCYKAHPTLSENAALIVLGGAIKKGRPCQTLVRRLDVAARLWHEAPSRIIVPTGGPVPRQNMTEAQAMARYLEQHGVARSAILEEPTALNTQQNIACSCALLDAHGHRGERCVVSSDYHLWRAQRYGRAQGIELTPIPAPTPWGSRPQQWCREVLTIISKRG